MNLWGLEVLQLQTTRRARLFWFPRNHGRGFLPGGFSDGFRVPCVLVYLDQKIPDHSEDVCLFCFSVLPFFELEDGAIGWDDFFR